jgi:DNA-binding HxlR family transcriptional regulator
MQALRHRDEKLCRVRDVLDRVGDKWSLAVINELGEGSRRFTEIRRGIPGISQRMLTSTVRMLERDGMLTRTVQPTVPPRVDYELTDLGRTFLQTAWSLLGWAFDHVDDIESARRRYDASINPNGSNGSPPPR